MEADRRLMTDNPVEEDHAMKRAVFCTQQTQRAYALPWVLRAGSTVIGRLRKQRCRGRR